MNIRALCIAALCANPAWALDVSSPYIKEGIVEIDLKNRYDSDHRRQENAYKRHSLSATYGVNRWWAVELGAEMEDVPNEGYGLRNTEIESTFQLAPRNYYWLDAAIRLSYQQSYQLGEADEAAIRLLLAKNNGRYRYLANIIIEQELGAHSNNNPTGELRLAGRYNWKKWLNPGLEYYADFNEWSAMGTLQEQRHRFGPALYGKIADGVGYETGIAFGATDRAEDVLFKFNVEYEFSL